MTSKEKGALTSYFHYGHRVKDQDFFFAPMFRHPTFTDQEYACGGTWIGETFAITTAHCLTYHDIKMVGHLGEDNDWHVILDKPKTFGFPVQNKYVYANYSEEGDRFYENDIGLVKVEIYDRFPLKFLPKIFTWESDWRDIQSKPVLMHGLGKTENDEYASYLKYMKGKLHLQDGHSVKNCNLPAVKMEMAFCMEPVEPFDEIDDGDMGNVVYYDVADPDNFGHENRVIVGIVSNSYGDPRNIVLTNVSKYVRWINQKILEDIAG
ncbi:phenoloxidase-activating factor 1-like [Culicoides brevitarsis]|uniref:phenoloxidase-activating factor 1-like n=1 Tax=Culicoides brevitarsis TaxID=469753 RepID=UPI00307C9D25